MDIINLISPDKQNPRVKKLISAWRSKIESIDQNDFIMEVGEDRIQLRPANHPKVRALAVDFLAGTITYRRKLGGGKNQVIAKAVGIKQGVRPSIVDATAGFGRDAFVLASLGCRVHMLERSAVMALLLEDGLARAGVDKQIGSWITERISLAYQDSLGGLGALPFQPDVVYLDPMYAKKKKTALVKKEMRVLKAIVGEDQDADDLLNAALQAAKNRVVVKRSARADWLNDQKPNMSLTTPKSRFDLYLV